MLEKQMIGQRVVITGGSSGIGLATARRALDDGADSVVLMSKTQSKLEEAEQSLGARVSSYAVDVTDEKAVEQAFKSLGQVDHVVLAAAGTYRGVIAEMDFQAARALFESKFWGQQYCLKHAANKMQSGGSITLFSGWISRKPMIGTGTLAAVDGAIESLTRVASLELSPVRVNAITPGQIDTPLWSARLSDEEKKAYFDKLGKQLPAGRSGTADDVAHAVHFLMTNSFVTGAIIDVDGGQQ